MWTETWFATVVQAGLCNGGRVQTACLQISALHSLLRDWGKLLHLLCFRFRDVKNFWEAGPRMHLEP